MVEGRNYVDFMVTSLPSLDECVNLVADHSAGAITTFSGTTRDTFQGKEVLKLEYEAYYPMATKVLNALISTARSQWSLKHVLIYHRTGIVPVGESSVIIAVSSAHRREGLRAVEFLIDELKDKCPIWKKEVYTDGSIMDNLLCAAGEFFGMCFFIYMALGGVQATLSQLSAPNTPTPDFGFSLLVNVWWTYRISRGVLNPAVLLALLITGNIGWRRGLMYFIAHLCGAMVGAALLDVTTPGPLLGVNKLAADVSRVEGVFLECFLTSALCMVVFFLAVEKSKDTFVAPICIGFVVFVAHLIGTLYDGTSINPARSFGPAVVTGIWTVNQWIFWVGPIMGALLASGLYYFFKWAKYELIMSAPPETEGRSGRAAADGAVAGTGAKMNAPLNEKSDKYDQNYEQNNLREQNTYNAPEPNVRGGRMGGRNTYNDPSRGANGTNNYGTVGNTNTYNTGTNMDATSNNLPSSNYHANDYPTGNTRPANEVNTPGTNEYPIGATGITSDYNTANVVAGGPTSTSGYYVPADTSRS
ncbi:hypothetical protein BZG36_02524 [Bifiguratus adelaidae]|uniref:Molybdopterin synthase catalytic subunit n=1 Tax=Bifiguratus adelaidae TaxID=1938954 RepID=A0A261Y2P4_9FUNG|nr:hypothetical protein BZG36_02524 [Bifiguratus adelaidae]